MRFILFLSSISAAKTLDLFFKDFERNWVPEIQKIITHTRISRLDSNGDLLDQTLRDFKREMQTVSIHKNTNTKILVREMSSRWKKSLLGNWKVWKKNLKLTDWHLEFKKDSGQDSGQVFKRIIRNNFAISNLVSVVWLFFLNLFTRAAQIPDTIMNRFYGVIEEGGQRVGQGVVNAIKNSGYTEILADNLHDMLQESGARVVRGALQEVESHSDNLHLEFGHKTGSAFVSGAFQQISMYAAILFFVALPFLIVFAAVRYFETSFYEAND